MSTPPVPLHRLIPLALILMLVLALIPTLPAAAQVAAGSRIGNAESPTAASIDISRSSRADGTATRVVVGRNDQFPDNLAGAAAAGRTGALLLVDPTPAGLTPDVGAEIARLLPTVGQNPCAQGLNAEVILLGGTAALSPQLATDLEQDYCVSRISGPSRVETSVAVAQAVLATGTPRTRLLVARDDNPADSAAAGAYAAATGTPIVVTSSTSLHPTVADLLNPAIGGAWGEVVLLGGTAALSDAVQAQIQEAAGAATTVRRIAGAARDDTALQIALQLWGTTTGQTAAIVNGYPENFWTYALPGGVASGAQDAPLLYVAADQVPATTTGYLTDRRPGLITIGPASQISDATQAQAIAAAGGTAPPPTGLGADIRVLDLTPDANGNVTVAAMPGDYSITVVARSTDGTSPVFVDRISGPGVTIQGDAIQQNQLFGDNAVTFPSLPGQAVVAGDYTFTLASDAGLTGVRAIVKSGDANTQQRLDANFYVVTNSTTIDEQTERDALATTYRQVGDAIFGPHNLTVGTQTFFDTNDALKTQYSQLAVPADDQGDPTNIRGLCGQLRTLSGPSRAINFAIVDNIVDIGGGGGGGETEGIAAGIPGTPVLADLSNSCVIIIANGGRGLDQLGTTTWHEAGHFLGLFHTTEADGANFDPLPDTPECPIANDADADGMITEQECGASGQNFMFYDSDSTSMTAGQAFVLRHNPLFRPAG